MQTGVLSGVQARVRKMWEENGLLDERITVRARTLTTEEAIGNPEGDDFPLQKGKERLMEAEFRGARGQAFTDRFGSASATLGEIASMPLENNYRRAVFVSACNAVLRHMGQCDRTVHCRDAEPAQCAEKLADFVGREYGDSVRITQVGYQPKMVESLARRFDLRVLDLDPDNIGQLRHGVRVEGAESTPEAMRWADLMLVTGSTIVNDTLGGFLDERPVIFFGTTVAGPAALMGWQRFCACSG